MQTRPFGRTGLQVPLLGFGAMQIGDPAIREDAAARLLHHVLDRGLTLITSPASAGEVGRRPGEGSGNQEALTVSLSHEDVCEGTFTGSEVSTFRGLQASVNLCDQQALDVFALARQRGIGTIAKRSLAGRPWAGDPSGDAVHDEYRRRYAVMRPDLHFSVADWDAFALRFAAFAPNVDCVIVGGIDAANVDRNVAAISAGPLTIEEEAAVIAAYGAPGRRWGGLV